MYEIDKVYEGFVYLGERPASNVDGTAYLFRHEKTDALIVYIKTKTDKKCFSMAFRTPCHDDTGVSHIIEHSVLEGSKKYPQSETLFHIEKHSVCDVINAYTHNERTVYHFSSRNEKDFDILFDYYMDGIMNPRFLTDASIFLREGWHLKNTKSGKVKVSGIVFNEMKAHMLNKFGIEYGACLSSIFPDTCYDYEAGGDICSIPLLNYDKAKEYYLKYYHPSNSAMVLYGDLDIEKYLKVINEEFFGGYKRRHYTFKSYTTSKATSDMKATLHYGIKPVTLPKALGDEQNDVWITCANFEGFSRLESITMHLMLFYCLSYNDHKIRFDMITKNLCEEMHMFLGDTAAGTYYGVIFENVPENVNESIANIFNDSLKNVRNEGVDYRNMKILIKLLKRYYTKDLVDEEYVDEVNEKILRGVDPFEMSIEECFSILEEKIENDLAYFSEFVDHNLIHAQAYDITVFRPDANYKRNLLKELDDVVNPKRQKWTKEEKINIAKTDKYIANSVYESDPASYEHEELTRDDITTHVEWNKSFKVNVLGNEYNAYVIPGAKSAFIRMTFDISNLSTKETTILAALSDHLFSNYTKNRNNVENSYEAAYLFEDYGVKFNYTNDLSNDKLMRQICINIEVSNENIEKGIEFLGDILVNSSYNHLNNTFSILYWSMLDNFGTMVKTPNVVAPMITKSHYSKADNMRYQTMGPESANFLYRLLSDNQDKQGLERLARKCQKIFNKVFNASRIDMYIAGSEDSLSEVAASLDLYLEEMPKTLDERDASYVPVVRGYEPKHEGASFETLVQYNALSVDVREAMKDFKGDTNLICNFLQEWVVHKLIREVGNAYGSSIKYNDGVFTFTSYRDPQVSKTLDSFVNAGATFKALFDKDDIKDFEKHKVSVAGRKNLFDSEIDKISAIEGYKRHGKTEEDMQKDAEKVFDTTKEDLMAVCDMITEAVKDGKYNYFCIGDLSTLQHARDGILTKITMY